MNKNVLFSLSFSVLSFLSCSTTDISRSRDANVAIQDGNLSLRISQDHSGVVSFRGSSSSQSQRTSNGAKILASTNSSSVVSDLPLTLIAEVAAPSYNGFTLRATHVTMHGNLVYVSYNYEGDKYLGAVDLIDITNPYAPKLVQSAAFPDIDISSLIYKDGYLYLAGAKESYSDNGTGPAILMKMKLNSGNLTTDIETVGMPGYVATDVIAGSSYVYAVSGSNGIVGAYSLTDTSKKASLALNDLKAVGVVNGQVVALQNGALDVLNSTSLAKNLSFSTSKDVTEAKRTIDFYNGNVLAAEGANGVGIYNLSSGTKMTNIPVPAVVDPSINPLENVSNAVSINNEYVFVANGSAGVAVHKIVSNSIGNLVDFGSLNLSGSANYVESTNGYVFVAAGFGGLKILKMMNVDSNTGQPTTIDCTQYASYSGGSWMNVNSGDNFAYSGAASLSGVNVNSKLAWCGSLTISDQLNVNSGGEFYMKGSLAFGSAGKSLFVNANSKLRIEGSLVIFGNLVLNSGATLEFVGTGSTITVMGSVTKGSNVTITGTYTDSFNSLK